MMSIVINQVVFLTVLMVIGIPLGKYTYKVMTGQAVWLDRLLKPIEGVIYRLIGKESQKKMTAKNYGLAIVGLVSLAF